MTLSVNLTVRTDRYLAQIQRLEQRVAERMKAMSDDKRTCQICGTEFDAYEACTSCGNDCAYVMNPLRVAPKLSRDELLSFLRKCDECGDIDAPHSAADLALLVYLNDPEIAKAFFKIGRYYS